MCDLSAPLFKGEVHLFCASKQGMSSRQLARMLDVAYKTAWFMTHRIRLATSDEGGVLMRSDGGIVEADEAYIGCEAGRQTRRKVRGGHAHKEIVFALVA